MIEDGKLADHYFDALPAYIHDEGFRMPPMLGRRHDGGVEMIVPAGLSPEQILDVAHLKLIGDRSFKEVVFALDRKTKSGQGTKYDDVLTVFWWYGPHPTDSGFRMGVVNYKTNPVVIEPIDWNNEFWIEAMHREIAEYSALQIKKLLKKGFTKETLIELGVSASMFDED